MQAAFKTRYYLYALVAGALLVFSFAPFNLFPIAYLSPAALFYLMIKARQRNQMVKLGWAFGVGGRTGGVRLGSWSLAPIPPPASFSEESLGEEGAPISKSLSDAKALKGRRQSVLRRGKTSDELPAIISPLHPSPYMV